MTAYGTAIDLFAGAGGATQGLRDVGMNVVAAVEFDANAARTYALNHPFVQLWREDIRGVSAAAMMRHLAMKPNELTLLKACPPCQGFSSLADGRITKDDPRNELVNHTVRFVRAFRPLTVMVENVPGLGRDIRSKELVAALSRLGYASREYVVDARHFGVPQRRKRYVLLAVRGKSLQLPDRLGDATKPTATVRQAFEALKASIGADDPLMTAAATSSLVKRRIEAIPMGGTRFDLPEELRLACHSRLKSKRDASGSYGRMSWDDAAPTMTTRCTTPSCGSFIHPELDRAITLREAAALQTFPPNYAFFGTRGVIERQIGNAVPVQMASQIVGNLLAAVRA
jgi:DNA (cytosine-5)-methyltransferase 1